MSRNVFIACVLTSVVTAVASSMLFIWQSTRSVPEEMPPEPTRPMEAMPVVEKPETVHQLQTTIEQQAKQIAALQDQLNTPDKSQEGVVYSRKTDARPRQSYLNQLKAEDPERHARVRKHLLEKNEQTVRGIAESAAFLFNLDMDSMTPEQVENHSTLLRLMEDSWQLADQIKADPEGPEAKEAQAQVRSNVMAMREAYQTERQAALEQWIQRQGYAGNDVQALRAEIEDVYARTDPSNILPGTQFVGDHIMVTTETEAAGPEGQVHSFQLNIDALQLDAGPETPKVP